MKINNMNDVPKLLEIIDFNYYDLPINVISMTETSLIIDYNMINSKMGKLALFEKTLKCVEKIREESKDSPIKITIELRNFQLYGDKTLFNGADLSDMCFTDFLIYEFGFVESRFKNFCMINTKLVESMVFHKCTFDENCCLDCKPITDFGNYSYSGTFKLLRCEGNICLTPRCQYEHD